MDREHESWSGFAYQEEEETPLLNDIASENKFFSGGIDRFVKDSKHDFESDFEFGETRPPFNEEEHFPPAFPGFSFEEGIDPWGVDIGEGPPHIPDPEPAPPPFPGLPSEDDATGVGPAPVPKPPPMPPHERLPDTFPSLPWQGAFHGPSDEGRFRRANREYRDSKNDGKTRYAVYYRYYYSDQYEIERYPLGVGIQATLITEQVFTWKAVGTLVMIKAKDLFIEITYIVMPGPDVEIHTKKIATLKRKEVVEDYVFDSGGPCTGAKLPTVAEVLRGYAPDTEPTSESYWWEDARRRVPRARSPFEEGPRKDWEGPEIPPGWRRPHRPTRARGR